ncbi:peptidase, S1 (chymotrypsin) family protein [Plesiocystis pacifica SIR-1]|uniref:Peptidase, S1 (Chymotrypsin) family protein n=1 Tax=Plesiocystis pacifica SIR-1 TaxID=391625 RepID=A6G4I6_9BACT|nr:peptidase, S1 (chymotrypsin) family protein [Plesiocystis pacifica SIR-1]
MSLAIAAAALVADTAHAGGPEGMRLAPVDANAWTDAGDIDPGVEQDPAIYGGTSANYCGWPTAVYLDMGFTACTGTLVHPDIVITAAHCPSSTSGLATTIRFGEGQAGGERAVQATCYSNPAWNGAVGPADYGYCRLNQPVTDIPIVPPAYGCDVTALTPGREVTIVGFGQSNNGGSGTKRQVTTTITAIGDQAQIGGNGLDSCQGDSGGPVYVKLDSAFGGDDTWRVFGITSGGGACGTGGIYALMHEAIPWIEQHSGVDITPCQDVQGNWLPTPECGGMPYDPGGSGNGTWANGCSAGAVSGFGGLCGEPFGAEDDTEPPYVQIVTPNDGDEFPLDGGSSTVVTIGVAADDGEGYGVAEVRLLINGNEFPNNEDTAAPFQWDLTMTEGAYTVQAVALDFSGNEAFSNTIGIGVGDSAPEESGGEEGEDSGDDGNEEDDDGGDEVGADSTGGGFNFGDPVEVGCACSSEPTGSGSGGWLGLIGLIGLVGLRRRLRG